MKNKRELSGENLSAAQKQIWAGQQIYPQVPLYNMALSFRIRGPLNAHRFANAFQQLVEETDVLRTVIVLRDGEPRQLVLPEAPETLSYMDFSQAETPSVAVAEWMEADCVKEFVLSRCAWRSALLRLGADDWVWYFNQHHTQGDILSFQNLYRRLSQIYDQPESGAPKGCYGEYLAHERSLSGMDDPAARGWFSERDNNIAPLLYGRDVKTNTTKACRVTIELSEDQSRHIRQLATDPEFRALTPQMSHYSIFGTLLCAFLWRISGDDTITLGTPVHNRPGQSFRSAAGMFTAVLPMQIRVEPDDDFRTLFTKFRSEATGLLRHAGYGCSNLSHQRSFNTVYNFITASFGAFAGMPCQVKWLHAGHCDPHHHLRFQVEDFGENGQFTLHFDLNAAQFTDVGRADVVSHFNALLTAVLADLGKPVGSAPMIPDKELAVQTRFLTGQISSPATDTLISQIEHQCEVAPDAVALRCGRDICTYARMERRATDLARVLAGMQIGPGSNVALLMPRGMSVVIAMLATMKTGAAFVPLDPDAPLDRLAFQLGDMEAAVVLVTEALSHRVPDGFASATIGDLGTADAELARTEITSAANMLDPAYVLYTSGSTGTPKGVVVSNGSAAHYIAWAASAYVGRDRLAFPLFTPLTFDLTITSLFLPLTTGGEIVIYPQSDGKLDTSLLAVMRDDAVDIIKLTPSHLRIIEMRDFRSSRIRQMIVGGEDFPTDLARTIHEASDGKILLHNEYGPTEATVGCIHHTFDAECDSGISVPIGKPITNMFAKVLNPWGQPPPIGVPGELWLGGDGLAQGYLKRPEMTEERFCKPHGCDERMYRTGDLVRLDEKGTLHYLGRIDQQLKINGVRIEPGEVETAITAHPAITACVAIAEKAVMVTANADEFCPRCGLSSSYPDAEFDSDGLCSICKSFEAYRDKTQTYFDDFEQMLGIMSARRSDAAPYDCIALLSGGKDSTYMLARLVDLELRVLAFTLDNGFISNEAKANIARVIQALGVDHVYGSTAAMNEIFVDSLRRNSNVCHGCFKTIYTLSMQMARDRGIPYIVTGLSRGQFFETRLTPELFEGDGVGCAEIDAIVLQARKAYHRVDDSVSRHLDVGLFQTDEVFEQVEFIDFYRYCDVSMQELYAYLDERLPWVRPSDTGRSTNCLINDVGIYVHKQERGYHNYALPYSWDVRLGHKERDAAREELDDDIDEKHVANVLERIGYSLRPEAAGQHSLTAYYTADSAVSEAELRAIASKTLPHMMLPAHYERLEEFPLSPNGKIDRKALAALRHRETKVEVDYIAPGNDTERDLAEIWQKVLKIPRIGVRENFYDLGGDSIAAIQIVARANAEGYNMRPAQLFDAPTVAELAAATAGKTPPTDQAPLSGPVLLTPGQEWLLGNASVAPPNESQVYRAQLTARVSPELMAQALADVEIHHDGLRSRFFRQGSSWQAEIKPVGTADIAFNAVGETDDPDELVERMNDSLDIENGSVLSAAIVPDGQFGQLLIVAHHLVVDALSWPILIEDLFTAYEQRKNDHPVSLPHKTGSVRDWAQAVSDAAIEPQPDFNRQPSVKARACREIIREFDTQIARAVDASDIAMQDVLLIATALAYARATGTRRPVIHSEQNGRDTAAGKCDVSRTVGWFTRFRPLAIDTRGSRSSESAGWAAIRALCPQLDGAPAMTKVADYLFNYLGRADALIPSGVPLEAENPLTLVQSPDAMNRYALIVNVALVAGRLQARYTFHPSELDESVISAMTDELASILRSLQADAGNGSVSKPRNVASPRDTGKLANLLRQMDKKGMN